MGKRVDLGGLSTTAFVVSFGDCSEVCQGVLALMSANVLSIAIKVCAGLIKLLLLW